MSIGACAETAKVTGQNTDCSLKWQVPLPFQSPGYYHMAGQIDKMTGHSPGPGLVVDHTLRCGYISVDKPRPRGVEFGRGTGSEE